MADFDDFDLTDGFGDSDSTFEQPQDQGQIENSELGDFATDELGEGLTQDKMAVIKTAGVVIIIGAIIVLLVISVMRLFGGKGKDKPSNTPSQNTQQIENNRPVSNSTTSNGWTEFAATDEITFSKVFVDQVFTITDIKHIAKVVDGDNNLEVKTVLIGSISGYTGTYELEVPYSLGCLLKKQNHFGVKVQVGEFNGKSVIGEILYEA